MNRYSRASAVAVALSLGGCVVPMRYYDAPSVRILVVDARTQTPVVGADVVDLDGGKESPHAITAMDGRVALEPSTHWILTFVNWDPIPQPGTLRITAKGYRPKDEVICYYKIKSEPVIDVSVALEPADSPGSPNPASPGTPASPCR